MSTARVCLVSLRGVNPHAAWCSNYEFEDVIASVDDVDTFTLTRGGTAHGTREWLAKHYIWYPGFHYLTPYLNPGVQPIRLDKDYDLFVFVCMNPDDLIYLSAVEGWKERCKTKICVMVEFYTGWLREYRHHLELLKDFDHMALCFGSSVEGVQNAIGRPSHHVPLGADVLRFSPYPAAPARCIDVYSMGRRPEELHTEMQKVARANRNLFYIYDTIPGVLIKPRDPRQHRELVSSMAQRARFFVTYPAKVDTPDETRGQSEVGARFFEGAAAGAILIGQAPTSEGFRREFDWPDAVVDVGAKAENVAAVLSTFFNSPERAAALGRTNAVMAMRRFDWAYRWKEVLRIAGLQPLAQLNERLTRLGRLADETEALSLVEPLSSPVRGYATGTSPGFAFNR